MARTRAQIKAVVQEFTKRGTEKATLIELMCDEALRLAIQAHPFMDAQSEPADIAITASATSVSLSTITGLRHIISARIVDASNDTSELIMRSATWWDMYVANPAMNNQGWPSSGLWRGTSTLYLDCPADSGLSLKMRVATDKAFTTDSTECPVAVLDMFVTNYVVAKVYQALEQLESYKTWYFQAVGLTIDVDRKAGGLLLGAIEVDQRTRAEATKMGRYAGAPTGGRVSIQNGDSTTEDYGNVRLWQAR